jgi:UDP-GlcNAc:undecaprenyl-phosphate GlcNAc-1-phosphate transferase
VPLYDFVTVNLIRLYHRVPPWIGDNNHISHRLVRLGLSRRAAVLVIYAATLLTGLVGLLLVAFPTWNSWLLLAVPSFAFSVAVFDLAKFRRQSES